MQYSLVGRTGETHLEDKHPEAGLPPHQDGQGVGQPDGEVLCPVPYRHHHPHHLPANTTLQCPAFPHSKHFRVGWLRVSNLRTEDDDYLVWLAVGRGEGAAQSELEPGQPALHLRQPGHCGVHLEAVQEAGGGGEAGGQSSAARHAHPALHTTMQHTREGLERSTNSSSGPLDGMVCCALQSLRHHR